MSPSAHPVRSITATSWKRHGTRSREQATPVIIIGGIADTDLARRWSPGSLAARFPRQQVSAVTNLPEHGVPYRSRHEVQNIETTVEELVAQVAQGKRCYLVEYALRNLDGLDTELDLSALVTPPVGDLHLWLGNGTRSGLHYDRASTFGKS